VAVIVVDVGSVRVLVLHRAGRVRMAVGLRSFPARVRVLMMLVVDVDVRVAPGRMDVTMHVTLVDQEPGRQRHERRRAQETDTRRPGQHEQASLGSDQEGRREIGAGARRVQLANREAEQDEAPHVGRGPEGQA